MDTFNEFEAESQKAKLIRAIKPDRNLSNLPSLLSKPKKVLLIVPPGTVEESYGRLSAAAGELPMLGIAYIASSLIDQGHNVEIIDYEVTRESLEDVETDIKRIKPDVIGMTAYITNMKRCAAVCSLAKKIDSNIITILGGPQVTIFPDEAFLSKDVDIVVLSEGEIIIRNVMNTTDLSGKSRDVALKNVKGIWFRASTGKIEKNEREGLVENLDIFPSPSLDLFDLEKYYPPVHIRGKKVAHFLTSRGCPFKCTFCETKLTFGRSFRYHTTERIIKDLQIYIDRGYKSFQFYDDIFTANRKRVNEFCDAILDKKWKIQWMCFTRTNCVDEEMLKKMKKAGCYLITFGGESGDDELLEIIKKDLKVETNLKGITLAKKHGIQTMSSFMLGLPTETKSQTLKTINFAIDSKLDYAVFPITEPYPGTELWIDAQKYGRFDSSGNYKNNLLSEHSAVWIPNGRTREELENYAQLAMRKFYLRPKVIMNSLLSLLYVPIGRVFRYYFSGFMYFFINRFKKSRAGARY